MNTQQLSSSLRHFFALPASILSMVMAGALDVATLVALANQGRAIAQQTFGADGSVTIVLGPPQLAPRVYNLRYMFNRFILDYVTMTNVCCTHRFKGTLSAASVLSATCSSGTVTNWAPTRKVCRASCLQSSGISRTLRASALRTRRSQTRSLQTVERSKRNIGRVQKSERRKTRPLALTSRNIWRIQKFERRKESLR